MVMDPAIPPRPRKMRNPYLSLVTKLVMREKIPRPANPASKTIDAGNKSESRPENNRNAAKQSEYEVMICYPAQFVSARFHRLTILFDSPKHTARFLARCHARSVQLQWQHLRRYRCPQNSRWRRSTRGNAFVRN
jgi:hypothetical protein